MIAVINEFSIEAVRDALQKLDDFDNLIVNGLTAFQLNEIETIDPLLFAEIAKRIEADRWYPSAGMWLNEENEISEEKLLRNILYSAGYFKDNFGKTYTVFHGSKVYNNHLAQLVYAGRFNAVILDSETQPHWLDSADGSRTLVAGSFETADINDIDDDFIKSNEFTSFEKAALEIYTQKIELETVLPDNTDTVGSDAERLLIKAEKISAQNGEDKTEEIQNGWISLFLGDEGSAKECAEKIICGRELNDGFIKINSDDIELISYKFAEDNSGEKIIRIKETAGTEKSLTVMCKSIDAGFRCEIMPYELQTFRIDSDGFVKEVFITE